MAVDVAGDGEVALGKLGVNQYDVVVLDRHLPVCTATKCAGPLSSYGATSGILMLTASGGIEDRVEGLELGADDHLPKSFAFAELVVASAPWAGGPKPHVRRC